MRVGILSRDPLVPSTVRLLAALEARSVESVVLPVRAARIDGSGGWDFPGAPRVDGVIARIGSFMPGLARTAVRAMERSGLPVFPHSDALDAVADKWRQLERLAAAGLPTPRSIRIQDLDRIDEIVAEFERGVVWKPVRGDRGRGIEGFRDASRAAERARERLAGREEIYAQAFIATGDPARDLRVIVVDGRVVAAMARIAAPGEIAANLHRGGRGESTVLEESERRLAIAAARAFDLPFAGVDLVRDVETNETFILEVNASPGLDGIARATGADVAGEIIDHACGCIRRR